MRQVSVEVRNKSLTRLGTIPRNLLDVEVTFEHNAPGTWKLRIPTTHPLGQAIIVPGSGIVVSVDGEVVFSGPTTEIVREATFINGVETVEANGIGDLTVLGDALAFPTPNVATASGQLNSHDVRTGRPEALILAYVDNNIGPLATATRKNTALRLPVDMNIPGLNITRKARFDNLLKFCEEIATTGKLAMTARQIENGFIDLAIRATQDVSASVRLAPYNGMVRGSRVTIGAPEVTRAVLAGAGDLVDRTFVDATTDESLLAETAWGRRIEKLVDRRDLQDDDNLVADASDELTETGKTQISAKAVLAEADWYGLFVNWEIGDIVAVQVAGVELKTQVRGAVVKASSAGTQFGLVLGENPEKESEEYFARRVTQGAAGLSNVQIRGNEALAVARSIKTEAQSVATGTATALTFQTATKSSPDAVYTASISGVNQPGWVINKSGVWNITAMATFAANTSGTRSVTIVTPNAGSPVATVNAATSGVTAVTNNVNVYLPAGSYVVIQATQNSGAALNVNGEAAGTSTFARLALINR